MTVHDKTPGVAAGQATPTDFSTFSPQHGQAFGSSQYGTFGAKILNAMVLEGRPEDRSPAATPSVNPAYGRTR